MAEQLHTVLVRRTTAKQRITNIASRYSRVLTDDNACQTGYMLAIQRFVNNRECAILQSGDSLAFNKYENNRRVSKDGVSPLFNTDGELSVTEPEKASILNQQFSSVFIDDDRNLPAMNMRTTAELSSIS